jgi:hypothetical protein
MKEPASMWLWLLRLCQPWRPGIAQSRRPPATCSNYYGGAVDSGGTTTVRGGTFRDNRNDEYGGLYDQNLDPVTLRDSALFGNQPDNCYPVGAIAGCIG